MDTKKVRFWILLAMILGGAIETVAQERRITAREVVAEIQKQVGVEWKKDTVDTFKAGNPDAAVTGIAVTMMATMDVLQRASAKGLNLVITHEPTFYAHVDTPKGMPNSDPVWAEKRAFIENHGMVVWRFHDHWHMRKPDGIEAGIVHSLGWEKFQNAREPVSFRPSRDHTRKVGRGSGDQVGFVSCACSRRAGDESDEGGI